MSTPIAQKTETPLPNPKVVAEGVDFWYTKFHALKKINLQMPERHVTALIGPSGCGKSTFLRCLNRMNDLIEGTRLEGNLTIDGHNIYAPTVDPVALRKSVGMVFQKPNPFPMSIYENITYGPKLHGKLNRSQQDELVERCLRDAFLWEEVKDKLRSPASSLSGGQQQRLCIARTLSVQPEVILMDEPCSALDPIATQRIEELIIELKKSYTIVIVTHNMQQAQRASDFTAFFMLGEMVESGRTSVIFNDPKENRTEDYISGRFG